MAVKVDKKVQEKIKVKVPKQYAIMLHNNHVTAFQAVVDVLSNCFDKNFSEAQEIMYKAHENGSAQCFSGGFSDASLKLNAARRFCLMKANETLDDRNMGYTELVFSLEELK